MSFWVNPYISRSVYSGHGSQLAAAWQKEIQYP